MSYFKEHFCKQCQRPIISVRMGCRARIYCNNACKQRAYRYNREKKKRNDLRQQWQTYSNASQNDLEKLLTLYGEEAVQFAIDAIHHM